VNGRLVAGTAVVAAALAAVVLAVTALPPAAPAGTGTAGSRAYRTSTAAVQQRSLSAQTQVDATLGDAGSLSVVNRAQGTITALPPVGRVVRQGRVMYRVSGSPVVLLYGHVPAWRDLVDGTSGRMSRS
jgi:hypothetical protein